MQNTITVRGYIAATPEHRTADSGNSVLTFRVGSTPRWQDKNSGQWVDGDTNWYRIVCFRRLADHAEASLRRGDPVIVTGRPQTRQWENDDGEKSEVFEISAQAIGHDLSFGRTEYTKANTGQGSQNMTSASGLSADTASDPWDQDNSPPETSAPESESAAGSVPPEALAAESAEPEPALARSHQHDSGPAQQTQPQAVGAL